MSTSPKAVRFDEDTLWVSLSDGRTIAAPLAWFPRLLEATPEQRARLQAEFKTLLLRTYSGAMSQAKNLSFSIKPMRSAPEDKEVIVRTLIKGRGDPVQLDYRLVKTPGIGAGWKVYNFNVLGVWLVDTYRTQFAQEINAKGIDGLIATLAARNLSNANKR